MKVSSACYYYYCCNEKKKEEKIELYFPIHMYTTSKKHSVKRGKMKIVKM